MNIPLYQNMSDKETSAILKKWEEGRRIRQYVDNMILNDVPEKTIRDFLDYEATILYGLDIPSEDVGLTEIGVRSWDYQKI